MKSLVIGLLFVTSVANAQNLNLLKDTEVLDTIPAVFIVYPKIDTIQGFVIKHDGIEGKYLNQNKEELPVWEAIIKMYEK